MCSQHKSLTTAEIIEFKIKYKNDIYSGRQESVCKDQNYSICNKDWIILQSNKINCNNSNTDKEWKYALRLHHRNVHMATIGGEVLVSCE